MRPRLAKPSRLKRALTHSQWLVRPCAFRSIRTEAARLTDETERRAMTHDAAIRCKESIESNVGRQTVDRLRTRIACRYGRGAPKWVPMQEHIESVDCPRPMLRTAAAAVAVADLTREPLRKAAHLWSARQLRRS